MSGADRTIAAQYDKHRDESGCIDWRQAEPKVFADGQQARRNGEQRDGGFTDPWLNAAWVAGWDSVAPPSLSDVIDELRKDETTNAGGTEYGQGWHEALDAVEKRMRVDHA